MAEASSGREVGGERRLRSRCSNFFFRNDRKEEKLERNVHFSSVF